MAFSKDEILRMYPNVKYYVINSNGGLLAGAIEFEEAKKQAQKYKKEYINDSLNKDMEVYVCDKNKVKIYIANSEEQDNKFHLYTTMYNLRNNREERANIDLAYLEDREKGISCYLSIDGFDEKNNPEYMLVLSLHQIEAFDDEFENIYTRDISKNAFESEKKLREEMQEALDIFENFIEEDKKTNRFYNRYYESEETEELE